MISAQSPRSFSQGESIREFVPTTDKSDEKDAPTGLKERANIDQAKICVYLFHLWFSHVVSAFW
jgi:hypothetical protein